MSFVQLSSLDDILNRSRTLDQMGQSAPDEPEQPQWIAPRAEEPYGSVGNALGMDGNEVRIILKHFLNTRSPATVRAFEKFLFVAKLDAAAAIEKYHQQQNEEKARFTTNSYSWQRRHEAWERQDRAHKARVAEVGAQIRRRWLKLINSLLKAIEITPRNELSSEDQVAIQCLVRRDLAEYKGDTILLNVSAMSVLSVEEITDIIAVIHRCIEPIHGYPDSHRESGW